MRVIVTLFAVVATLAACDRAQEPEVKTPPKTAEQSPKGDEKLPEPGATVKAYQKALAAKEYETAYGMVSPGDRAAKPFEEYQRAASDPLQSTIHAAQTHTVKDVQVDGDEARVAVETEGPDVIGIQQRLIRSFVKEGKQVPTTAELKSRAIKEIESPDAPTSTLQRVVFLTREDGRWWLDFDWDKEHPQRGLPVVTEEVDAGTQ